MCSKIEMKYDYYLVDSRDRMDKLINLLGGREINGSVYPNNKGSVENWVRSCVYNRFTIPRIFKFPKNENYNIGNISWMPVAKCEKLENYKHWLDNVIKL